MLTILENHFVFYRETEDAIMGEAGKTNVTVILIDGALLVLKEPSFLMYRRMVYIDRVDYLTE